MLYRAAILAVAVFCGTMWTLLIRSELQPSETAWRTVPLAMVLRPVFAEGPVSDLVIRSGAARAGRCRITPHSGAAAGDHVLEITGDLDVEPAAAGRRTHWRSIFELGADYQLQRMSLSLALSASGNRAVTPTTLDLEADFITRRGHFRLATGRETVLDQGVDLDQSLGAELLKQLGLPASLVSGFVSQNGPPSKPLVVCRQAQLTVHGERLETYLVTVTDRGRMLLEAHVSQLGQVLQAETILGWKLTVD